MKTLSIILLVLSLVFLFTSVSLAQDWRYELAFGEAIYPNSGIIAGAASTASDNYDTLDQTVPNVTNLHLSLYHSAAEGWTGTEGYYMTDIRQPFVTTKTWDNIYMWWNVGATGTNANLYAYSPPFAPAPANYQFTLYLDYVPTGIAYSGPWSWQLPNNGTMTLIAPAGTFTPFASATGLDSYKFHLTVTAVPEPSSLVALLCGLIGVGGALYRRRLS